MNTLNPRAVIGDNVNIDQAQIVTDRLASEYAKSVENVEQRLNDARVALADLNGPITSDTQAPHWPCRANLNGLRIRAPASLMNSTSPAILSKYALP